MFVLSSLYACQSALGAYGLWLSLTSISRIQQYESQTKTAAKWSAGAEQQLYKARTTQTSGALTIIASLVTSLLLVADRVESDYSPYVKLASPALAIVAFAARVYLRNWWAGKAKVPLMDQYNEAISRTNQLSNVLGLLAGSWIVVGVLQWTYL